MGLKVSDLISLIHRRLAQGYSIADKVKAMPGAMAKKEFVGVLLCGTHQINLDSDGEEPLGHCNA